MNIKNIIESIDNLNNTLSSPQITDWLMVAVTGVYVLATILICIFNYKSANATKEQTNELKKQFIENTRARIIPDFCIVEGVMFCIRFKNIGKNIATKVKINICDKWLDLFDKVKKFPYTKKTLAKLKDNEMYLTVEQEINYPCCIIADGTKDFDKISEEILEICIKYNSGEIDCEEIFYIDLKTYKHLSNTNEYIRMSTKKIEVLKKINTNLFEISKKIT